MAFSYDKYKESQDVLNAKALRDANSTYKESDAVVNYRNQLEQINANKPQDWTGGLWGSQLNDITNKLNNREAFTYDMNADALYQQYKDQYITQGRLAMQDTMGQAAAMTGGYGNSYASTAGNQAYQGYLQQLNDIVPQLYAMAMDKYKMEGDALKDQYSVTADMYNREYGEHRDSVSDWNTERNYLTDQYNNERNYDWTQFSDNRNYYTTAYESAYNKDYGQYSDDYNRAFSNYQQQVSEDQWNKSYSLQQQELALEQASLALKRQQAEAEAKGTNVKPTQTDNANKLKSYIKTRAEWSRGTDATYYTNKGMKYEDYVEDVVNQWYQDGKIDDGEALWLFNTYNIK